MSIKRKGAIESGMPRGRKPANLQGLPPSGLGQHWPRDWPSHPGQTGAHQRVSGEESRLGPPLDIRELAAMLGCSPWSIRNRLIPMGLPHFRFGASSKLIFYRNQVERWIERQQRRN